eukprot:2785781-Pleurochrysis_carterae.AAC.2
MMCFEYDATRPSFKCAMKVFAAASLCKCDTLTGAVQAAVLHSGHNKRLQQLEGKESQMRVGMAAVTLLAEGTASTQQGIPAAVTH